MTQDEIFEMARCAELNYLPINELENNKKKLLDFAKLVAQHEREACVKIVENEAWQYTSPVWAFEIVNDIRARGQA
jgi:hypothetical protein